VPVPEISADADQQETLNRAVQEVARLLRGARNNALDTEALAATLGTDALTIERLGQVMERNGLVDLIYPSNVLAKTQLKLVSRDEYSDRARTGIPGLDEQVEGGFERRSVVLVTGDSGSGKTTFCLQFLVNGAEKYGEPGIYITFEEKKEDVFRRTKRFGWDLEKLERENKLLVMEYPPHEIERFISEGQIIEDTIHDMGAKRIVIDSVTSLALVYDSEYKRRQGVLKTLETLKKWGCTALLTSESRLTAEGEVKARFGMSYLVDGVIYLYNMRRGDRRVRAFEILKLRGISHSMALCPLAIENHGVVLYPNQPVFGDFGAGGQKGF